MHARRTNRAAPAHHYRLVAPFMLCLLLAGSPAMADREIELTFDRSGLTGIDFAETNLLASSTPEVRQVLLADEAIDWNAREHPHPLPQRRFTEAATDPTESSFDADQRTLRQRYPWGRLAVRYAPTGSGLKMTVTVNNTSKRAIHAITVDLLALDLPPTTRHGVLSSIEHWARDHWNLAGPHVPRLQSEAFRGVLVSHQPGRPLHHRFEPRGKTLALTLTAGGDAEVYDRTFVSRPIPAGASDSYAVELRLAGPDTDFMALADDVFEAYAEKFPMTLDWPDRRPIGMMMFGDHRTTEDNPRGWRHGMGGLKEWSIKDDDAIERFKAHAIRKARDHVANLRAFGMQGFIVWNPTGQQFNKAAYYGEPRLMPLIAPEMEAAADAYFKIIRDAGFRVGICIRPPIYYPVDKEGELTRWETMDRIWGRNWVEQIPEQFRDLYSPDEAKSVLARLDAKISYAKKRWGATLFYIDTNHFWRPPTVKADGAWDWQSKMLNPSIWRALHKRHPDVLLLPEHESLSYWAHTVPYRQPPRYGSSTPRDVRAAYPRSMSLLANLPDEAEGFPEALLAGDIPMFPAWYGGPVKQWRPVLDAAAAKAACTVVIHGPGCFEVNGRNADSLGAMQAAVDAAIDAEAPIARRRVVIEFAETVGSPLINKAVESVGKAGGVVLLHRAVQLDGE